MLYINSFLQRVSVLGNTGWLTGFHISAGDTDFVAPIRFLADTVLPVVTLFLILNASDAVLLMSSDRVRI